MIQFACPKCKKQFKVPGEAAGKVGTCKKCGAKFRVPSPKKTEAPKKTKAAATAEGHGNKGPVPVSSMGNREQPHEEKSSRPSQRPEKAKVGKDAETPLIELIRSEFDGAVPRGIVHFGYQISLMVVATLMVIMPLLYVGVIAGTCYGLYYYCTEVMPGLMRNLPRGRAAVFAMALYISPIFGGGVMILFMIKPIFFTLVPGRGTRQRSIGKASEPEFVELVHRICEVTRSPKPKRIDVDYHVNASASLRRGLLSLFTRDLVLTIGIPLVAGMNTRQLAGVLAHEFGHFAQGGGMKLTYTIRGINFWFARVVYQRDTLDYMLDDAIRQSDFRISAFLLVAKLFVIISRAILWLFMNLAHLASCWMLRQMEYDADRYEAHVAGSEYFAETSTQLNRLGVGQQLAIQKLIAEMSGDGIVTNLPEFAASAASGVSQHSLAKMMGESDNAHRSLFATHPSDGDRIKAAKKQNAEGMFQIERPARELFRNYETLCQNVTMDFYRNELGVLLKPDHFRA